MAQVSTKKLIVKWFLDSAADISGQNFNFWEPIKTSFFVPLLTALLYICLAMSFLLFVEWVYMIVLAILIKLFWKKPEKRYKWEPIREDLEMGSSVFPMVLVQIPIFNEIEVYKISIGAACNLSWPSDRLLVQVLDDSTDPFIKDMIEKECVWWGNEGINIVYQTRETREGHKAGSLKAGLNHDYIQECEYVAIFDADFQPEPDFLMRAIPFLMHNADIALVQARWRFANVDQCLLTRLQEMSPDYQFQVDEEGGSSTYAFFSFNGSAGVWRISTINEAGGWNERTTVEDMDLAVRSGLKGRNFVYLGDLHVKSELPSTFQAYRSQQHRWFCGPANLFRKMAMEIVKNKEVSFWRKVYMLYNFFFVRRIIGNVFIFLFYCVVLPLSVLIPEVDVPKWEAVIITCIIAFVDTIIATPRSVHLCFPWLLFENVMSFHRTKSIFMGLTASKKADEWVVTAKFGDPLENKKSNSESSSLEKPLLVKVNPRDRILMQELGIAVFLLACGCYSFFYGQDRYFIYLFLQFIFFTLAGFGCFGATVSSS